MLRIFQRGCQTRLFQRAPGGSVNLPCPALPAAATSSSDGLAFSTLFSSMGMPGLSSGTVRHPSLFHICHQGPIRNPTPPPEAYIKRYPHTPHSRPSSPAGAPCDLHHGLRLCARDGQPDGEAGTEPHERQRDILLPPPRRDPPARLFPGFGRVVHRVYPPAQPPLLAHSPACICAASFVLRPVVD